MNTGLGRKVNKLGSLAGRADRSLGNRCRIAGDSHDRAIVIGVERVVEEANAVHLHRGDNLTHDLGIHTFGKVGDALED